VVESDREPAMPERWQVVRQKWYGTTLVLVARALAPPAPAPERGEQAPVSGGP
jgi:hypothetical protein